MHKAYVDSSYSYSPVTGTITARLPDELVRRVYSAVRRGSFSSRSEALRNIVKDYLSEHPELVLEIDAEILFGDRLSDSKLEKLGAKLFSRTKVSRLVGEGRRR